jgi:hypothetical protein
MKPLAASAVNPAVSDIVSRPASDTIHRTDVCHSGLPRARTIHDSD